MTKHSTLLVPGLISASDFEHSSGIHISLRHGKEAIQTEEVVQSFVFLNRLSIKVEWEMLLLYKR